MKTYKRIPPRHGWKSSQACTLYHRCICHSGQNRVHSRSIVCWMARNTCLARRSDGSPRIYSSLHHCTYPQIRSWWHTVAPRGLSLQRTFMGGISSSSAFQARHTFCMTGGKLSKPFKNSSPYDGIFLALNLRIDHLGSQAPYAPRPKHSQNDSKIRVLAIMMFHVDICDLPRWLSGLGVAALSVQTF